MQTLLQQTAGPAVIAGETLVTRKWSAHRLQVSIETLKRWERRGLLQGRTVGPKLVRYVASDVEALARGR